MGKSYDNYYGSNKEILEEVKNNQDHGYIKETIAEFEQKSYAKIQEFLLQWKYRNDPRCLNSMINIRLRLDHLTEFEEITWRPLSVGVGPEV